MAVTSLSKADFKPKPEYLIPLQAYVDRGLVSLQRWSQTKPSSHHGLWASQTVVINHCIMHARYAAEWVLVVDFDEFLSIDGPSFKFLALDFIKRRVKDQIGSLQFARFQMRPPLDNETSTGVLHLQRYNSNFLFDVFNYVRGPTREQVCIVHSSK
jgi:hypothetical protein